MSNTTSRRMRDPDLRILHETGGGLAMSPLELPLNVCVWLGGQSKRPLHRLCAKGGL